MAFIRINIDPKRLRPIRKRSILAHKPVLQLTPFVRCQSLEQRAERLLLVRDFNQRSKGVETHRLDPVENQR